VSKSDQWANDVLDAAFNNGSSGTFTVGSTTYTLPIKAELTTTVSTSSASGTLVSGGSYAAQSLAGNFTTAAASKTKASTGALTYSNMPACTWADVYLRDSTGTPKFMNFRGGSSLGKAVNAGDTALIPAASLTGNET
jgi:hypothetical protein